MLVQLTFDQIKLEGCNPVAGRGNEKFERTILRTGSSVQIKHNSKTILPCPLEGTQDVGPTRALEERLSGPHVDGPEGNR